MAPRNKKPTQRSTEIEKQIDENLRRVYDETVNEALPDRFSDLLAQLKSGKGGTPNDG
jgi:hypothetical protein